MRFPKSRHDDQVNSTTQALAWLTRPKGSESGWLEYAADQMEKWMRNGTFPPGYFSKESIATLRGED